MKRALLILFALGAVCSACEAIDNFSSFQVFYDGGADLARADHSDLAGADLSVVDGPMIDAAIPDFANADLAGGSPQDMRAASGDMQMPCVIGQSLIGGCFIAN